MPDYKIIRPVNLKPRPTVYEEKVAELCAKHFKSDVSFIVRASCTTPDILVIRTNCFWEIKNIKGSGRHVIEDNLRKASKQSENIIISLLASTKLDSRRVERRIRSVLKTQRMRIKSVLLITRSGKIIDIK